MMGSGACWIDADADGFEDLFLVNGKYNWTHLQERYRPTGRLYLSNGDGSFRDATAGSGLAFEGYGNGCSVADWNSDGCLDLYVAGFDLSKLFQNRCDATFEDVTASAGVTDDVCPEYPCFAHSSGWADYDRDGDLDLYVANYVKLNQSWVYYNAPGPYEGQPNALYRNNGDGTFTESAVAANLTGKFNSLVEGKSLGVAWQDYDLDGDFDVYVANDETPAYLFSNDGDGTFTDIAPFEGVNYTRAGMGVAWGDWDNNGCPDLIATHFASEMDGFIRNYCGGDLEDESGELHGINANPNDVRWGVSFVDYDNDGWKDIWVFSGGVYYDAETVQWLPPDQAPTIYHNERGTPGFSVSFTNASALAEPFRKNVRGAAFGDFDHDGGVDAVAVANNNETARVYRTTGAPGRWIEIQLRDPAAKDRFAYGARVEVVANGVTQTQQLFPSYSFESSNSLTLHFGVASDATVDSVKVRWPRDGAVETWTSLASNHVYRLTRGGGIASDTISPLTTIHARGTPNADASWVSGSPGFEITAADRAIGTATGVTEIWYTLDGGPATRYEGFVPLEDGVHAVTAWSVDGAGNRSPVAARTIRADTAPPTVEFTLQGTPAASGWYTISPVLTITGADATSGIARLEYRDGVGAWTTWESPTSLPDGEHAYEIRAIDAAGLVSESAFLSIDVDATPLAIEAIVDGLAGDDGWWRSDARVSLAASDATSGVATMEIALGSASLAPYESPITLLEGRHVVQFAATDNAGNRATGSRAVNVDATSPVTDAAFDVTPGNAGWTRGVVATLLASDATSGVRTATYRVNDGPETAASGAIAMPEGDVAFTWRATDVAGNAEAARSESWRVDSIAPVTRAALAGAPGENGWWRSAVTVTLDVTETGSGVSTTSTSVGPYAGPVTLSAEGENAIEFSSADVAGNAESAQRVFARVDTVAPTAEFVLDHVPLANGWMGDVRVRSATADATSGVALAELAAGGVVIPPGTALPEGEHTLTLRVKDVAGNEAPIVTRVARIDERAPETDLRVAGGGSHWTLEQLYLSPDARLALEAADAASGVTFTWYAIDGGDPQLYLAPFELTGAGEHVVEYWSEDGAGRVEARNVERVVVDAAAPALDVLSPEPSSVALGATTLSTAAPVTVAVGESLAVEAASVDAESGVARVLFLVDGELRASVASELASWTWTLEPTDAGARTITVVAIDRVGNASSESRDVVVVWAPLGGQTPA